MCITYCRGELLICVAFSSLLFVWVELEKLVIRRLLTY